VADGQPGAASSPGVRQGGHAVKPYYQDEHVTLYHGDCRTVTEWLAADVLVTDPPYGRGWRSGQGLKNSYGRGYGKAHGGIAGDNDTGTRDAALSAWGDRLAVVFGDPLCAKPAGAVQALIYAKPLDAGIKGARAGFRRDAEAIYLCGPWPARVGGRSSILATNGRVAGPRGMALANGHPHAKPVDVMETLISACPPGVIADPFAGSGSTLVAARNLGRKCIGVEVDERYCEQAARRLSQMVLGLESALPLRASAVHRNMTAGEEAAPAGGAGRTESTGNHV
jgi:DNA methylase